MKNKNLFYSMAAALLLAAGLGSCSGDDEAVMPVENNKMVTLTATLGAKNSDVTRALAADGKTTWEVNEEIAVYYQQEGGSYATGTATVKSVDETTKKATIEASLTNPKSGTVKLVYPASLANTEGGIDKSKLLANQKGTLDDISANWDAATNSGVTLTVDGETASLSDGIALTNQLCIVKYTLKDAGGNAINAKPLVISVGTDTYTVTPSAATSELYVAMLPVTNAAVSFTATVGSNTYAKTYSGITLAQGKFYSNSTVKLAASAPTGAINGKFSVGPSTKVYFSKGNLQLVGENTWKFADNQWNYFGESQYKNHRDLFGWGTKDNPNNTSATRTAYSWNEWGENTNLVSALGSDWRTLTSGEWKYLFSTRTVNGGTGNNKSYTLGQKVNDVLGAVLYPDDYTGSTYSGSDWSTFEAKGCVFLPAAGQRKDEASVIEAGSSARYWSSTAFGTDYAYSVFFNSGGVHPVYSLIRSTGNPVRLVRPVE